MRHPSHNFWWPLSFWAELTPLPISECYTRASWTRAQMQIVSKDPQQGIDSDLCWHVNPIPAIVLPYYYFPLQSVTVIIKSTTVYAR